MRVRDRRESYDQGSFSSPSFQPPTSKLGCNKSKISIPLLCCHRRRKKRRKRHLERDCLELGLDGCADSEKMKSSSNDRLGASLFPAPASQQRVPDGTAGSRNKVALKPGRSLMDWIRLTHSGKDLTGVGGKLQDVTPEELAKHCNVDDAWICLKGKVYNVTAYAEYHPGGQDELMRGVGKDATDLFNEVHKWVNFESMLEKCLVGRLKASTFSLKGRSPLERELIKSLKGKIKSDNEKGASNPSDSKIIPTDISKPNYDWFQTEKSVSIVVYTKCKDISSDRISLDLKRRTFRLLINVRGLSYLIHIDLEGDVASNVNVKIGKDSGAVEFLLSKSSLRMWSNLGNNLEKHDTFLPTTDREIFFRDCILSKKCQLTRDTYLFSFELPLGTILNVPIGHHVRLKVCVKDVEVCRSYTPVTPFLLKLDSDNSVTWPEDTPKQLHLMVKIYPGGVLTPVLNSTEIGKRIPIGDVDGSFDDLILSKCDMLCLLAAGTGFTPMVRLIVQSLSSQNGRKVKLLFFNKTENDIPWRDELDTLAGKDDRFKIQHVLSEPPDDWPGSKGRIGARLLEEFLSRPEQSSVVEPADLANIESNKEGKRKSATKLLICVCGPPNFTNAAIGYLKELGYRMSDLHAFKG